MSFPSLLRRNIVVYAARINYFQVSTLLCADIVLLSHLVRSNEEEMSAAPSGCSDAMISCKICLHGRRGGRQMYKQMYHQTLAAKTGTDKVNRWYLSKRLRVWIIQIKNTRYWSFYQRYKNSITHEQYKWEAKKNRIENYLWLSPTYHNKLFHH